jgi:hypothetical protein
MPVRCIVKWQSGQVAREQQGSDRPIRMPEAAAGFDALRFALIVESLEHRLGFYSINMVEAVKLPVTF